MNAVKSRADATVAEMVDRFATIDLAGKWKAAVPFSVGEDLGPHLTQCRLSRGIPQYQVAS